MSFLFGNRFAHPYRLTDPGRFLFKIVLKFIDLFSKDPYGAVDYLIKQSNIPTTGIAGFLFKTTELDRTRLGEFLSMESNEQLLKGFVARFSFHDVRIDEALRTFLLSIRLPTEANASEQLLRTFAVQWHEANSDIVTFDKLVLVQLVLAIMQLNVRLGYRSLSPLPPFFSDKLAFFSLDLFRMP